ncbi:MAG: tetraacyldisaccharide 4'-kinase [Acidobacteriaceae bacterium]
MKPQRLLLPLVPLYAAGLALKNRRYHGDKSPARRLHYPVLSVGNLSVGGSGKTPVVLRLVELAREQNIPADVLSRGYQRSSQQTERVPPEGPAARYGDEPLLIAQQAGVPVYVGASRYEAGRLAEREIPGPRLHILDDGFQHRQLHRDLDIVVLHASDFHEFLLPAGRLREPLSALRRAHIFVLRAEDRALQPELRRRNLHQPVWIMHRELAAPPSCKSVIAFCGIARPNEFFQSLAASGLTLSARTAFPDHHTFTDADITHLLDLQRRHPVRTFLTTEKDAVRLSPEQRSRLEAVAALRTAQLRVHFEDESQVRQELLTLLAPAENAPAL